MIFFFFPLKTCLKACLQLFCVYCFLNLFFPDLPVVNRITRQLKPEGTSGDCLIQAGSGRAGCLRIVQSGFECLQGQRLHKLSGQPVPTSEHLHRKKFFLMFKWNFLYFILCPSPLIPSLDKCLYILIRFLPQLPHALLVTFTGNNFTNTGVFYAL